MLGILKNGNFFGRFFIFFIVFNCNLFISVIFVIIIIEISVEGIVVVICGNKYIIVSFNIMSVYIC